MPIELSSHTTSHQQRNDHEKHPGSDHEDLRPQGLPAGNRSCDSSPCCSASARSLSRLPRRAPTTGRSRTSRSAERTSLRSRSFRIRRLHSSNVIQDWPFPDEEETAISKYLVRGVVMSGGLATTARFDPESVRADGLEELLPRLRDAFGAPLGDAPSGQVAHARCGGSPAKTVDDGVRVGVHGDNLRQLREQAQGL